MPGEDRRIAMVLFPEHDDPGIADGAEVLGLGGGRVDVADPGGGLLNVGFDGGLGVDNDG